MRRFTEKVLEVVRAIPRGQMMTYAAVARRAGSPGASRAVGSVLKKNFNHAIPCHRVIRSDGSLGEYNRGGPEAKARILRAEGAIGQEEREKINGTMKSRNATSMLIREEKGRSKRGKQNPNLVAHKKTLKTMFEASRLEGKVKNVGIKNVGHQKKKSKA